MLMKPSSAKRVLLLVPSLAGGGAERVITTLLRNLDRSRFELHLGILEAGGAYLRDIPGDVEIHPLNIRRVRYAVPGILKLIRMIEPQTVLSTLRHLNIALGFARPFFPRGTQLILRESVGSVEFADPTADFGFLSKWLCRHLYKRADRVVCLSNSLLDDLVENLAVPREKAVRIYNPVEIRRILEFAQSKNNPFRFHGTQLLAIGNFTRPKGFDVLLNALPTVLREHPDARLTFLGDGPLLGDMIALAQQLGILERVNFEGFQSNPWAYMRHADVFVFPSRYEGMPNALLEAVAIGTRAVASDCPGGIREIKDSARNLVLVPPENPQQLSKAIIAALAADKPKPESLAQVEKRMEKFTVQSVVNAYSALL